MTDRIDRLLAEGQQNREAVNIAMLDDHRRWAAANTPCAHPTGTHWPGDAGWWA